MAARAQEISQEAGSRIAQAMKDVINAAAGLAGFAVESARDLTQYMVRRGQMTQEEADKLIREAEEAYAKRSRGAPAKTSTRSETKRAAAPSKGTTRSAAKAPAKSKAAKKSATGKSGKTTSAAKAAKKKTPATRAKKTAAAKKRK